MTSTFLKISVSALALSVMAGSALAGGFSRGTADTDILFEKGNVAVRMGVAVVAPTQDIVFLGANIGSSLQTYYVPNFGAKIQITDAAACAATYTTPFGGSSDFRDTTLRRDPTSAIGTVSQEFVAHEFGATCSYGFDVGPGKLHVLGGLFYQTLDFEQDFGGPTAPFKLSLKDGGLGWRIGTAYEIPEIALRAQLMYRSSIDVDATGTTTSNATGATVFNAATGTAEFPQSVEMKLQSGVAEGWLVYGGVKWTDWSSFDVLKYNAGIGAGNLNFFYRDGWTVNAGVAHRFNEQFAGTVNVTWDRGVSTGFDINSTSWTGAVGGSYTPNDKTELRFGVAYTYIESASQLVPAGVKRAESGHALAGSLSLGLKF